MLRTFRRFAFPGVALAIVAAAAACSNPVDDHDDHDHPEEVVIRLGNTELASATRTASTGALTVQVDQETDHLTVVFVDEHGDPVQPGSDNWLEVVIDDPAAAGFEQDTPGEFGGHLHGLAAGTTQAAFKFMHGPLSGGHPDFTSAKITITVTP